MRTTDEIIINGKTLTEILELHKLWLEDNTKGQGQRANLQYANLRYANLRYANLQYADLRHADLQGANLRGANLQHADLRHAELQGVDLQGADLRYAYLKGAELRRAELQGADLRHDDLQGADLDFSCLPLWCGSLDMIVDKKITSQIAYHFCRLVCDDKKVKKAQKGLRRLANQFYRVEECGVIK